MARIRWIVPETLDVRPYSDGRSGCVLQSPIMTAQLTHDVREAAAQIRSGRLVAFPTETVYGLGAHALDVDALARVFEIKERPTFDPIILHVAQRGDVEPLVESFPPAAQRLADRFWPGPLTMVLPKRSVVPDLATAGLPTVGVRVPDHPLALELLRTAGVPIAAPSANLFGCVSPTTARHVEEQLGDRIDLILDGGPCRVGVESTVLLTTAEPPLVLRPGGTPVEELEETIGPVAFAADSEDVGPQTAPGRLTQHYAPRTKLVLVNAAAAAAVSGSRVGLLAFKEAAHPGGFGATEVLSSSGDLREAAANFFAALRRLDAAGLELIVAERLPEHDLGRAVNDRLQRAAAGRSSPTDS